MMLHLIMPQVVRMRQLGARQSFAGFGCADRYRALLIGECRQGWLAAGRHGVLGAEGKAVIGVGKGVDVMGISVVVGALSVVSVTVVASTRAGKASQRVFRLCHCSAQR